MRKTLATLAAAVLVGTGMLLPASASASPTDVGLMAVTKCKGNVCIHLSTPSGGRVNIEAWAYRRTFYGNFDLTGPNGLYRHGETRWWNAGERPDVQRWNEAAVVGTYCALAFENGTLIGKACADVR